MLGLFARQTLRTAVRTSSVSARNFASRAQQAPAWQKYAAAGAFCTVGALSYAVSADTVVEVNNPETSIKITVGASPAMGSAGPPNTKPEDNYPVFHDKTCYVAKFLTKDMYVKLFNKGPSKFGTTIDDVIQCAVDYPILQGGHLSFGLFAGDEDCYDHFEDLFKPMIKDYHGFDMDTDVHTPDTDPGNLKSPNPDPEGKYIISTRIRAGRQIKGLRFPATCSRSERRKVESLLKGAFAKFSGEIAGTYYPLVEMTPERKKELIEDKHFLFEDPDMWTITGGFARDWPDARGIFINNEETAMVWVNEEDHMRCMSMKKGADAAAVFKQWAAVVNGVESHLTSEGKEFAIHPKLGSLTGCPSNLGTGMRASVHVKLPLMGAKPGFKKYCKEVLGVQVRGRGGEKDTKNTGVYDISNLSRLGKSEVALVDLMLGAVGTLIKQEKTLEKGGSVSFGAKL